ncbi:MULTISPECIES: GNAT family N-acetyltransferase [Ensifer]|jgi:GNAT superfamily N-acetyltransferase|uniref:GNAT family N-acetyltransferase n=1 Tax=Ensifer canadensis TaxID=555315 RepID=A0AAW4FPB8_9HYPH|nr:MULTISPECIES: GNAT family N-acetyltransferase [Ensifer]AHK42667.1 putative N-acetyltransferase [Ensifer adhaerens OV14]MDP9631859.1 GNAT superfamily N-acetyltransferase [Ensifer adhaerens]KQU77375.1 GCN5 family acetyltransferase [Ensifer sp. Root31]KQW34424.1 GCN5 family acetyltransferase [Ensifer sp. Root1252]KQW56212.1 GCN5 family acetyltransferase [Ensifer sp. Root127]
MKTVSIEVRPGEPQEASAIADVHRVSWLQAYGGIIPHRPLVQMVNRRDEVWWRKATRGPATLLVVDVAGTIAGYATLGLSRAKALPQEGEIYEIYLRPEYQGIGLGRVLFGEAKSLLRSLGCRGLVVWCLEDSDNAYQFFQGAGGSDIAEGMEDFGDKHLKKIGFAWN